MRLVIYFHFVFSSNKIDARRFCAYCSRPIQLLGDFVEFLKVQPLLEVVALASLIGKFLEMILVDANRSINDVHNFGHGLREFGDEITGAVETQCRMYAMRLQALEVT